MKDWSIDTDGIPLLKEIPPMPPVKPPKLNMKTREEIECYLEQCETELANSKTDTHCNQRYIDFLEIYILALKWVLNEEDEEDD
jgi:hypothetical protein